MSKVFRFSFDDAFDEDSVAFPQSTTVKHRIYVDDCSTWVPVLWQFCKFLEASGYEGVKEKVVIKTCLPDLDNYLFETIYEKPDWQTDEEDHDYNEEK